MQAIRVILLYALAGLNSATGVPDDPCENSIADLKKMIAEGEAKLKQQQNLYRAPCHCQSPSNHLD